MPNLLKNIPVDVSKSTRVNMDNVFNTLLNLNSARTTEWIPEFTSNLAMTYNRIQMAVAEDAPGAIRNLKLLSKWYIELIRTGTPCNPGLPAWDWDSKLYCPIIIRELVAFWRELFISKDKDRIYVERITYALLSIHRVIMVTGSPALSTITDAAVPFDSKVEACPKAWNTLANGLGFSHKEFKGVYDRMVAKFRYEVLTSAGCNGDATWTAHSDAKAFMLNPSLLETFATFAKASKMDFMIKHMLGCVEIGSMDTKHLSSLKLGRLHSFDEMGGKVRTVAIVDYWTQMLLTPLHNTINHFLRRVDMDGTFDQDKVARRVADWTRNPKMNVYSYDLTAATDRLPVSLQVKLLSELLGDNALASGWRDLLVNRDYVTSSGDAIRYACGQPMGARSSFPMLALTHHLIVQHAALMAGKNPFTDYVVLGDDMTICGEQIGNNYLTIMEHIGVPINMSKSIVHEKERYSAGEICKRIFINGNEISTISPKLIAKATRDGKLGPELQNSMLSRGWHFPEGTFYPFFFSILDRDAFRELVLLNTVPLEVSGLYAQVKPDVGRIRSLDSWFDGIPLTEKDVIGVFTYAAATDQLKRLDALLRNTLAVGNAISERFSMYTETPLSVNHLWAVLGIPTDTPANIIAKLIKPIDKLTPSHPIIQATEAEITRVTELLSGLIAHDTNMHKMARDGLIDRMRNALTDTWIDTETARAQGTRTLLTRALTSLKGAIKKGETTMTDSTGRPVFDRTQAKLEYTVVLTSISRLWIVRWGLDSDLTVNAVQSRVSSSIKSVLPVVSSTIESITI